MTFWDHIEELSRRLKVVLYTLVASTVLMMVLPANLSFLNNPFEFYEPLVAVILRAVRDQTLPAGVRLIGLEFMTPVELYLVASFFFGFAITAPVLAYEIFKFIDPALYPHERRGLYPFLTCFLVLFITGLIFGYVVLVPYGLTALLQFFPITGAEPYISVSGFYHFVFFLTLMTGLVFTFPAFLVLFVKYGLVETKMLTRNRRYVYFALIVLAFIITPGEGGLANFMLIAVAAVLFEAAIFFAKHYEKKRETGHQRWFTEKAKCRFCGKPVPTNKIFCPNCGKSQK